MGIQLYIHRELVVIFEEVDKKQLYFKSDIFIFISFTVYTYIFHYSLYVYV